MSERELAGFVNKLIRSNGLFVYHTYNSRRSARGWPDLVIVGSKVIYRELKRQAGQVDPEQVRVGQLLRDAGADFDIWRPSDLHNRRIHRELEEIAL